MNLKKCLIIGAITVVLWGFSLIIGGVVDSRSQLSKETQKEVAKSWSKDQDFVGPMLCVPVCNDTASSPFTCMYILPEHLEADADIQSETLHRGIFDASVYRSKISMTGTFSLKESNMVTAASLGKKSIRFDWQNAQIVTAISDKRGIEEAMHFTLGDQKAELDKRFNSYGSTSLRSVFNSDWKTEMCSMTDLSGLVGKEVNFTLELNLKGSDELSIAPIGRNSQISIHGNSSNPSFKGMVLPSSREITDNGFAAMWKVSSLNRSDVNQMFTSDNSSLVFDTVGTKIMVMGGQYTQTDRVLKYAFLVILLSLAAVLVAEMSVKSEINVLNYILIGAALLLFYLMLLSFAEWMGFGMAYGLSALLIVGMITLYLKAIVRKGKTALAVCLFMTLVDVFIYVLLGIEDMALLVGTLGLFFILGVAMFFSLRLTSASKGEDA